MKRLLRFSALILIILLMYAGWVKIRSLGHDDGGPPLAVRWEGFYHDLNLRDVGTSINQCLGETYLREDLVLRAAGWFSGWSCDKVDNPEVIYSLNYSPARFERYFCQAENGKNVGRYFNHTIQLKDLESVDNWSDKETRLAGCRFLRDIFTSILEDRKLLMHCDAGRDRTGAFAALLTAMAAEIDHRLDESMLDAIECDYRKTASLHPDKFGDMKRFIQQLQARGGVATYLEQTCQIPPGVIPLVAQRMLR